MLSKTLTQTGTGACIPWIPDIWANPQSIGVNILLTGAATYSLQGAYDDFSPLWDLVANPPNWVSIPNFGSVSSGTNGTITGGPYTLIRINVASGTGTVIAKLVQNYAGHTI